MIQKMIIKFQFIFFSKIKYINYAIFFGNGSLQTKMCDYFFLKKAGLNLNK